jgi:hypothetical protein
MRISDLINLFRSSGFESRERLKTRARREKMTSIRIDPCLVTESKDVKYIFESPNNLLNNLS